MDDYDAAKDARDSYFAAIEAKRARGDSHDWEGKPVAFLAGRVTLYPGDCLDVLASLPENSVDSVVCDPPYGLEFMGKEWDAPWQVSSKSALFGDRERKTPGFGTTRNPNCQACGGRLRGAKKCDCTEPRWDEALGDTKLRQMRAFQDWCEAWARECLRVLKPGGHMLAFGGTRTYHRMAVAIEDGGFEIRDQIGWAYGSGFPKSHDISKAIDKLKDWTLVERLSGEIRRARSDAGLSLKEIGGAMMAATSGQYGSWYHRGGHMFFETGRSLPSRPEWSHLCRVLPIRAEFLPVYDEAEREVIGRSENGIAGGSGEFTSGNTNTVGFKAEYDITAPATEAARQWQGWGTALKPAWEPICVARKPLSESSIAANVLKHGTGAINIDDCRIDASAADVAAAAVPERSNLKMFISDGEGRADTRFDMSKGRWPANLIHDGSEEVLAGFPETTSGKMLPTHTDAPRSVYGQNAAGGYVTSETFGDSGSAARFFASFPVTEEDRQWQHGRECRSEPANNAGECLSLQSEAAVSALSHAVAMSGDRLTLHRPSYRAPSMSVTASVFGMIETLVIATILNFERRFSQGLPLERLTLSADRVALAATPRQTGTTKITINLSTSSGFVVDVTFDLIETNSELGAQDLAQASRLFYTAKADAEDRIGSKHPTVKPLDLKQYLCRMVTPPGGTVLDCFAGTGTTGEAAWREGFRAILIEREPEYQADIARRMELVLKPAKRAAVAKTKNDLRGAEGTPLFGDVA